MKTIDEIREDLRNIRYYYTRKKQFDKMRYLVKHEIVVTVDIYNFAIKSASVVLYDLYMSLYVFNGTLESVAEDWDVSFSYIRKINTQLIDFFQANIKSNSNYYMNTKLNN